MADEEQAPSSRKRVAGTQINKDNPEPDDDGPEQEMGTFKKATEEVMATRRIVKVRRQPPSSASSNPFSAIRFTPNDSSAQASAPVPEPPQPSDVKADEGSNGTGKDNLSVVDKNARPGEVPEIQQDESAVKTDSSATTEAPPQPVETSEKEEDTKDGSGGDEVVVREPKEGNSMSSEAEGKTKEGEAEEKEGAAGAGNEDKIIKDDTEKKDGGELETKDGLSGKQKDADNKGQVASATPLFSFTNLSSGQNAFTGLAGTGFSSSSFSFGSAAKDGSSAGPLFGMKTDGSSFPSFNIGGGATDNGSSSTALATPAEAPKKFAMTEGPVETGEENEKAVFTADSALYEYLDGGWKERGKGELKLNVPVSGGERARLVMRTKGNYRLVLNASLYEDMSLKDMDKKGVTFACMNSIGESQSGFATFALKLKDTATRDLFKNTVESHKTRKASDAPLKMPENSPKAAEEEEGPESEPRQATWHPAPQSYLQKKSWSSPATGYSSDHSLTSHLELSSRHSLHCSCNGCGEGPSPRARAPAATAGEHDGLPPAPRHGRGGGGDRRLPRLRGRRVGVVRRGRRLRLPGLPVATGRGARREEGVHAARLRGVPLRAPLLYPRGGPAGGGSQGGRDRGRPRGGRAPAGGASRRRLPAGPLRHRQNAGRAAPQQPVQRRR